jgi:hypothetical protein
MTEYLVTWRIFVEARTPEEAALGALAAQRNAESAATCFDVSDGAEERQILVCPSEGLASPMDLAGPARPPLKLVKTSRA